MQATWETLVNFVAGKSRGKDREALKRNEVNNAIDEFNELFAEDADSRGHDDNKISERKSKYTTMINHYYDLVTDFYEYGWGASFHFAPRFKGETFDASLARHEHFLASRLGLKPGMRCIDVGSGIGGPMRAIARFSGANVVGANNNEYQIQRSQVLNEREGLAALCTQKHGDFMHLTDNFARESFDAAYAVEATCHAPDKTACFKQIFDVLKPGASFAAYEWCITERYDPDNAEHRLVKHQIEHGDSLPDLVYPEAVLEALEGAGFEIVDSFDVAEVAPQNGNEIPWYSTLQGSYKSVANFRHSKLGRFCTQKMVDVLETVKIAPQGTSKTHKMLCIAADSLARGGELGIFTPMFFFVARKPADASGNDEEEEEEEE